MRYGAGVTLSVVSSVFTYTGLIAALMLLFCVVPSDPPNETFHFKHFAQSDTIAPWGTFPVVFSEQLDDSASIGFSFKPSFYSYTITLNESRDTALVQCTEPLMGSSRYVLRVQAIITAKNDAVFAPQSDSIVIFTYPAEQEPNGAQPVADTLTGRCFGAIATVSDTDRYFIADSSAHTLFLNSKGSQTTFVLEHLSGSVTAERTFNKNDTCIIPATFSPPVYIAVYSYHQSVGGYYEIGFISR